MKKVTRSDIVVGAVFFHVYGYMRPEHVEIGKGIDKYTIIGKPYREQGIGDFVEIETTFPDGKPFTTNISLDDCGVYLNPRVPYNLNRIFHTEEDAINFQKQISTGTFEDPLDQEFFDDRWIVEEVCIDGVMRRESILLDKWWD